MTAVGDYKTYFTEMITTCDLSLLILTNKQTDRPTDKQTQSNNGYKNMSSTRVHFPQLTAFDI